MMASEILIMAKDGLPGQEFQRQCIRRGLTITRASNAHEVIEIVQNNPPAIVIITSDRNLIKDGLSAVQQIRQVDRQVPIILIARHSCEDKAIAAFRAGVNDYLKVPFGHKELMASVKKCLNDFSSQHELRPETATVDLKGRQPMIGDSRLIREVKSYLLKVAKSDSTVLITGETGTGKELAAELIHYQSARKSNPLVCVNCAALPESLVESELFGYDRGAFTGAFTGKRGKFELAWKGTIFLDEIGDMNPYAQAKILRSIENKEFSHLGGKEEIPMNARVIAATNQDPERLITEGGFRRDLYYRLNVARVHLPPLRDRKEDIPQLVAHAIEKLNPRFCRQVKGLSEEAMACLVRYDWPGNVRELMNLLEACYINLPSHAICRIDLPDPIQQQLKVAQTDGNAERTRILSTLLETNWNKSTAARKLEWSRMTLYRKMAKYHIVEKRNPLR